MARSLLRKLARAIVVGDREILDDYLTRGGDPNACDHTGCTLLHEAANFGQLEIVKRLLQAGADVNRADHDRRTPLDLVADLSFRGALTLANPTGLQTYAQRASDSPSVELEVVACLLDAGAVVEPELEQRESWGLRTPLAIACQHGKDELVALLLRREANPNARDGFQSTPLIAAVNGGHLRVIERLLRSGADPNIADQRGQTPLLRSIWADLNQDKEVYLKICSTLIKAGADPNLATRDTGETPIFAAISECKNDSLLMVLDAGGCVQHRDRNGDTALCYLVKRLHSRKLDEDSMAVLARNLVEAGANRSIANSDGLTPTAMACAYGFEQLARLLS